MMKFSFSWLFVPLVLALPFVVLLILGIYWLMQNNLLVLFFVLSSLISLPAVIWVRRLQIKGIAPFLMQIKPAKEWGKKEQECWQQIETFAAEIDPQSVELDSWDHILRLMDQVMSVAAKFYFPKNEDPVWEMPVPDLLKVVELVARDLRQDMVNVIPGIHILTINDVLRGKRVASLGTEIFNFYRIVSLAVNPAASLVREARGLITGKLTNASTVEMKRWLLQAYIQKLGFYAIELYRGGILLNEKEFADFGTKNSKVDLAKADQQEVQILKEPLRILIIGQVKAGKSSLINALRGNFSAVVDILPATECITPYRFHQDEMHEVLLFDSVGYEESLDLEHYWKELSEEYAKCDMLLLVCTCKTTARRADQIALRRLRQHYMSKFNKALPPVICVLSGIDLLRPLREWEPPYNVSQPVRPKEIAIREFMNALHTELEIPLERITPVCLSANSLYNLQEALIPTMLQNMDQSQRLKYLRCLSEYKEEQYWDHLWNQTVNAGKVALKTGFKLADQVAKTFDPLK